MSTPISLIKTSSLQTIATNLASGVAASATLAQDWAEKPTAPGGAGTKSSKTHAADSGASATAAANSATLSQNWAQSPTAPGGAGTKSSKTWAEESAASAAEAATQAGLSAAAQAFLDPEILAAAQRGASASGVARRGAIHAQDELERFRRLGIPRPTWFWSPFQDSTSLSPAIIPADGSGDLTVTRAGTGFRMNSSGFFESVAANKPRLTYDPITGAFLGALIEPTSTNRVLQSRSLGTAPWFTNAIGTTVTAGAIQSPTTGVMADLISGSGANPLQGVGQSIVFVGDGTKAISMFIRANVGNVSIVLNDASASVVRHRVEVTFAAGVPTLTTSAGAGTLFTPLNLGRGWWEIGFSATGVVAANNNQILILTAQGTAAAGSVYVVDVQGEDQDFLTSRIPTATATAQRLADVLNKTAVSSLIGQSAGTLYAKWRPAFSSSDVLYFNRRASNGVFLGSIIGSVRARVVDGSGAVFAEITGGAAVSGAEVSAAYRYLSGDSALSVAGAVVGSSASIFSFNQAIDTISLANSGPFAFGTSTYRALFCAVWNTPLTDAQLNLLTGL